MPVMLFNSRIRHGGSIRINKQNDSTKYMDKPYGQVSQASVPNNKPPQTTGQAVKPIGATVSYGGELLSKLHFKKKDKDKMAKIKL